MPKETSGVPSALKRAAARSCPTPTALRTPPYQDPAIGLDQDLLGRQADRPQHPTGAEVGRQRAIGRIHVQDATAASHDAAIGVHRHRGGLAKCGLYHIPCGTEGGVERSGLCQQRRCGQDRGKQEGKTSIHRKGFWCVVRAMPFHREGRSVVNDRGVVPGLATLPRICISSLMMLATTSSKGTHTMVHNEAAPSTPPAVTRTGRIPELQPLVAPEPF